MFCDCKLANFILVTIFVTYFSISAWAKEPLPSDRPLNVPQRPIHLDCYDKDSGRLISLELDLQREAVIHPEYLHFFRLKTFLKSKEIRLMMYDPDRKNPGESWTLEFATATLQRCNNDFISTRCRVFICYEKRSLIYLFNEK